MGIVKTDVTWEGERSATVSKMGSSTTSKQANNTGRQISSVQRQMILLVDVKSPVVKGLNTVSLTLSSQMGPVNILLCPTPDDFTCQCETSHHERVKICVYRSSGVMVFETTNLVMVDSQA